MYGHTPLIRYISMPKHVRGYKRKARLSESRNGQL